MTAHVEVMDLVAQMKAAEQAFVLATVVRTVSVTAAKAGAKAIIRPDGTIVAGWIGGGCARGAVLKAAREALADGEPRMVSVQPEDLLAELGVKPGENRDGIRFASNMCPSKGTMDIFVEPVLPHPSLVIFGASPVAMSLAAQARQLGYHVTLAAPAGDLVGRARRRRAGRWLCARRTQRRRGASSWSRRRARATRPRCARRSRPRPNTTPSSAAAARWRRCAKSSSPKASTRERDRPRQGAGRARSRRHHAGGDRDVDPGGDHGRAPARPARGHSRCRQRGRPIMQMNDSVRSDDPGPGTDQRHFRLPIPAGPEQSPSPSGNDLDQRGFF